jgi:hypothetical protein
MGVTGVEVRVYDPPLCCATGVCGASVDPALAQAAADFTWLADRGATVARFNLASEPGAFTTEAKVAGLLAAFGDGALPAVLVGDRVLTYGRYPSREELAEVIEATNEPAAAPDAATGGCAPGSGCC